MTSAKTSLPAQSDSMRASIRDGMAHSAMLGMGENYLGPLGIFLGASPIQVGILATLPPLIGALFQWLGVWLIERIKNRRRIIAYAATSQALIWLPIAALALIEPGQFPTVNCIIAVVCIYQLLGGLIAPAWNSLIGDLVPNRERGRFFGTRNKMCGIFNFTFLLLGGQILHLFEVKNLTALGYALIFGLAMLARLVSAHWLKRHENPPADLRTEHKFSFYDFLRRAHRSNFTKFVFFYSLINFSVAVAGPYFSLYMLRELHFSYLQFTFISATTTITQFLTMQHWGNLTDRYGNKRILGFCAPGVTITPLLWLISTDFWFLLLIQVYVGFVWAGYNLAAANFMFDAVTPPKRARCVAYQAVVNGCFTFAGSMLGGYLSTHPQSIAGLHHYLFSGAPIALSIFLLSGLLRMLIVSILFKRFHEVRQVESISRRGFFFQVIQIRPLAGMTFGISWGSKTRK